MLLSFYCVLEPSLPCCLPLGKLVLLSPVQLGYRSSTPSSSSQAEYAWIQPSIASHTFIFTVYGRRVLSHSHSLTIIACHDSRTAGSTKQLAPRTHDTDHEEPSLLRIAFRTFFANSKSSLLAERVERTSNQPSVWTLSKEPSWISSKSMGLTLDEPPATDLIYIAITLRSTPTSTALRFFGAPQDSRSNKDSGWYRAGLCR